MEENLKIAVIGAGAIGGITAAHLYAGGLDVELVCRNEAAAAAASNVGLAITGVRGAKRMRVPAVAGIEALSGKKDVALIVVKAYDMPDAARRVLPFLKPDSIVVSMQNGICTDALAKIVGANRTVGCVIGWGATMWNSGELDMTSEGDFVIGAIEPSMQSKLPGLKDILEKMMPVRISEDIVSDLYSKMVINACITAMGVTSGLRLGDMLKKRTARDIFLAIIEEGVAVADAMGLKLPPYGGKIDYYRLTRPKGRLAYIKKHIIIRIVGIKYRRLKSSSLQSLKRGKPTEVDYFNGYITRMGMAHGVATPVNSKIVSIIKEIEAGKRQPDPANFALITVVLPKG